MNPDYSIYRYYKGEAKDPFSRETQNTESNFWDYESIFEDKFLKGDFSPDAWVVPYADDIDQWKVALSSKDREEVFKIWLYRLLMEHLPEKYQSNDNSFLRLYYDTEV